MKTANELREITASTRPVLFNKAKDELYALLLEAAERGRSSLYISKNHRFLEQNIELTVKEFEIVIAELEVNGYSLEIERSFIIIKWER